MPRVLLLALLPILWASLPCAAATLVTDGTWVYSLAADGKLKRVEFRPAGGKLGFFSASPDGRGFALQVKKEPKLLFYKVGANRARMEVPVKHFPEGFRWSADGERAVLVDTENYGSQDIPQSYAEMNQKVTWIDLGQRRTGEYRSSWTSRRVSKDPLRYQDSYRTPLGRFLGWDAGAPLLLFQDPNDEQAALRVVPGAERADTRAPIPRGYKLDQTGTGCALLSEDEDSRLAIALPGREALVALPLSPKRYPNGGYTCDGGSRVAAVYTDLEGYKANRWKVAVFEVVGSSAAKRAALEIATPRGLRWDGADLLIEDQAGLGRLGGGVGERRRIAAKVSLEVPPFRVPYLDPNDPASNIPRLLEAMTTGDGGTRSTANTDFIKLGKVGAKALPELTEQLKDPRPDVRENAAKAMRFLGPDAAPATRRLIRLLKDKEPGVVEQAAKALQAIGTSEARKAIRGIRIEEPPPRVRQPR